MENFNFETTLPALSFDYDGLMKWAKGIAAKYENLVVREEDVAEIKKVMADLNKTKRKVDDARKETVKQVSAPIRDFESKIKEVIAVITETRTALDDQVKAHIEAERESKRQQVEFTVKQIKIDNGVEDIKIDIDHRWLNKSTKLSTIKAEVESIILAHIKKEREAAQIEQATRDRCAYIEEKCSSLAKVHGITLPPSQFFRMQNLDIPLDKASSTIESAYATKVAAQAVETTPDPAPVFAPKPPAAPQTTKKVFVEVEYHPEQEKAVEDALRNLQSVCKSARLVTAAEAAA